MCAKGSKEMCAEICDGQFSATIADKETKSLAKELQAAFDEQVLAYLIDAQISACLHQPCRSAQNTKPLLLSCPNDLFKIHPVCICPLVSATLTLRIEFTRAVSESHAVGLIQ